MEKMFLLAGTQYYIIRNYWKSGMMCGLTIFVFLVEK